MRLSRFAAILVYLFVWFLLFEEHFLDRAIRASSGYEALTIMLGLILIVMWFHFDAEDNNIETSRWLKISVFALPPAGVLYYKVKYFGWWSALKLAGIFIFFSLIVPTLFEITRQSLTN